MAHLRGRQPHGDLSVQGTFQQLVPQDAVQVTGHDALLLHAAVVLYGQDDGVLGHLRGAEPVSA